MLLNQRAQPPLRLRLATAAAAAAALPTRAASAASAASVAAASASAAERVQRVGSQHGSHGTAYGELAAGREARVQTQHRHVGQRALHEQGAEIHGELAERRRVRRRVRLTPARALHSRPQQSLRAVLHSQAHLCATEELDLKYKRHKTIWPNPYIYCMQALPAEEFEVTMLDRVYRLTATASRQVSLLTQERGRASGDGERTWARAGESYAACADGDRRATRSMAVSSAASGS